VNDARQEFLAANGDWNKHLAGCAKCMNKEYCAKLRPLAEANDVMARRLIDALDQR
jgi:hypothetical protein